MIKEFFPDFVMILILSTTVLAIIIGLVSKFLRKDSDLKYKVANNKSLEEIEKELQDIFLYLNKFHEFISENTRNNLIKRYEELAKEVPDEKLCSLDDWEGSSNE